MHANVDYNRAIAAICLLAIMLVKKKERDRLPEIWITGLVAIVGSEMMHVPRLREVIGEMRRTSTRAGKLIGRFVHDRFACMIFTHLTTEYSPS